jgi:hypothetical protein
METFGDTEPVGEGVLNYVSSLGQAIGFITASKGKGLLF